MQESTEMLKEAGENIKRLRDITELNRIQMQSFEDVVLMFLLGCHYHKNRDIWPTT